MSENLSVFILLATGCGAVVAISAIILSRDDTNTKAARVLRGVFRATLLIPVAWLLLFAALLLRARWSLGSWPYRRFDGTEPFPGYVNSGPDPHEFGILYHLLMRGTPLAALSSFVAVGAFLAACRSNIMPRMWRTLTLELCAYGLLVFVWFGDPRGFMSWFVD